MRKRFSSLTPYVALVFVTLGIPVAAPAQTYTFSTLYSFKNNSTDPEFPQAALVIDSAGNLYGTSSSGGSNHVECNLGCGTVFKVSKTGVLRVLHDFVNAPDGENPQTSLFRDSKGNLYGSTEGGGSGGCGTVFKITSAGVESVLYSFLCGTDGFSPSSVVLDPLGNIYGTAMTNDDHGLVFEIDTSNNFSVLYNFCSKTSCADGELPEGGVVRDTEGNLYGTTNFGGTNLSGVVFKLTPEGTETVLHDFAAKQGDGLYPFYNLIQDGKGNLYGVTPQGGAHDPFDLNGRGGTLYKQPEAGGTETVLYSFCALTSCRDGYSPTGPVVMDAAGNFYSTTLGSSSSAGAVVWKLSGATGKESVLHSFGKVEINSGLVSDGAGNLYGTTFTGGAAKLGSVYKLTLK
jgi:uncharacterized repeat protein (TIGR03803 family)